MAIYELTLPMCNEQVEKLTVGDQVFLTGELYTARDMAHLEIKQLLAQKLPLPRDLQGKAIFHAGPVVRKIGDHWEMVVIGPTTSIRMEPYAEMVGEVGIKLIIGKGGMSSASKAAFQKYKQAYLQAAPGCAVQLAAGVKNVIGCTWLEKGMPEAMWALNVEKMGPFIVTMDCNGNSRYDLVKEVASEKLKDIYG
jgi:fumarate hydratase subunit beta/L(+)-tartrate dehydratase beta subunit